MQQNESGGKNYNKILRIVYKNPIASGYSKDSIALVLSNLAIAESNLIKAGKQSALPHFIAIVKEIEKIYGFEFKEIADLIEKQL